MSRTDRHRPVPVQLADPDERNKARRGTTEMHLLHGTCACKVCSGWRRAARREARRQGKRALRLDVIEAFTGGSR